MKVNFAAAEQYYYTLMKNPDLPQTTKDSLKVAYEDALKTKDYFCSGKDCLAKNNSEPKSGPVAYDIFESDICAENKARLANFNGLLAGAGIKVAALPNKIYCDNFGKLISKVTLPKKGDEIFLKTAKTTKSIGKLGENIDLNDIMPNILAKNVKMAKSFYLVNEKTIIPEIEDNAWVTYVKPNGNWDYKSCISQKNSIFGLANEIRDNCDPDKLNKVFTKYTWLSYNFTDDSDIGNFNYGYTGRFVGNLGLTRQTLNDYAGYLQTGKDFFSGNFKKAWEEWKSIHNSPPFGDEMDDYEWSNKGMDLAESSKDCPCPK